GGTWTSTPYAFMSAKGDFGFAPTDAEVGPDGSLYVSVGGRGTRGGVFKVTYVGDHPTTPTVQLTAGVSAARPQKPAAAPNSKSAAVTSSSPQKNGAWAADALDPHPPQTNLVPAGDKKGPSQSKTAPSTSRRLVLNVTPVRRHDSLTSC